MSSFEIGAARPVGAVQVKTVSPGPKLAASHPLPSEKSQVAGRIPADAPQIVTSDAIKAGEPPVDVERVVQVRRAIEAGKYPITPAKIADAMIAAGMLLRNPK